MLPLFRRRWPNCNPPFMIVSMYCVCWLLIHYGIYYPANRWRPLSVCLTLWLPGRGTARIQIYWFRSSIFRHLKLELLTQFPASNDEKYINVVYIWRKFVSFYGYVHWRMTTEISVMYGSEKVNNWSRLHSHRRWTHIKRFYVMFNINQHWFNASCRDFSPTGAALHKADLPSVNEKTRY